MQAYLEVIEGRYAGTTMPVSAGEVCTVGGRLGCDLFLPDDPTLAPLHFLVQGEAEACQIQNCASAAALIVNGDAVKRTMLQHGDWIVAGKTLFTYQVSGEPAIPETPLAHLQQYLRSLADELMVLIDSAYEPRFESLFRERQVMARDLTQSLPQFQTATFRPWLISLRGADWLHEKIIRTYWGKGRCVFLTSPRSMSEVASYCLRLLLETRHVCNGSGLRFYDPRMLRTMLPECTMEQLRQLFGPITSYFVESQLPHTGLLFSWQQGELAATSVRFGTVQPLIPTVTQLHHYLTNAGTNVDWLAVVQACAQHFELPATLEKGETPLPEILAQTEKVCGQFRVYSPAARLQAAFVSFLLGTPIWEIPEISSCLAQPNFTGEEKLNVLVETLNQRRG